MYYHGYGKAYIYESYNDGVSWENTATFTSDVIDNWFGYSVAISGNIAIVGAPGLLNEENINEYGQRTNRVEKTYGEVYIYEKDIDGNWGRNIIRVNSDIENVGFGFSVAISGNNIMSGTRSDNYVYYFKKNMMVHGGKNMPIVDTQYKLVK